jgi:hypothetical protein
MIRRLLALLACGLLAAPVSAEEGGAIAPVPDAATQAECSACHIAYPAVLLPVRSWHAIMTTLDDHFGENAALDEATRASIEAYLVANAADANGVMPRYLGNVPADSVPLRISDLPWFTREHGHEVSAAQLKKAVSWSNCNACHGVGGRGEEGDDD